MEEVLPSDPAAASSSQPYCEPKIDETADECHQEDVCDGSNMMKVNATVKQLSLSESDADEGQSDRLPSDEGPTPISTLPKHKRRRKPRGGSKHTSISESSPIDKPPEVETISEQQEQKNEEIDHSDTILFTTTTTPLQTQQPSKQKKTRRRKKVLSSESDQQQQQDQQEQHEQQQQQQQQQREETQPEIHENDANDDHHDINEDEDDYPSSTGIDAAITIEETDHHDQQTNRVTSSYKKKKTPKRTIMEELTFLKRISSTRCQVDLGR